jgi:hypothetical protein
MPHQLNIETYSMKRDGLRKLLNSISIVGLGTKSFANALSGIRNIHSFAQSTVQGILDDYHADNWMGYPAITLANPVFSPKPSELDIASVDFLPGEDPKGVLSEVLRTQSQIRHLDENVVHCLIVKNRNVLP